MNKKLKIYKYVLMVINTISNEKNVFYHLIFCLCPECQSFHENLQKWKPSLVILLHYLPVITTIFDLQKEKLLLVHKQLILYKANVSNSPVLNLIHFLTSNLFSSK